MGEKGDSVVAYIVSIDLYHYMVIVRKLHKRY